MENKFWKDLSKESKEELRLEYKSQSDSEIPGFWMKTCMEALFGKENLTDYINTWDDVVGKNGKYVDSDYFVGQYITGNTDGIIYPREQTSSDIIAKNVAAFKIYKLIELGYGGVIKKEDLFDGHCVWSIIPHIDKSSKRVSYCVIKDDSCHLLSFHTKEQAESFLDNNFDLVKSYCMI